MITSDQIASGDENGPRTDAELLAAHVGGDHEAFGELVRRHRDRLWAVALRTLGDRDEAADALQDAFVSAYRAAAGFRGEAAVTTWLHRIVVNACLDRIRRRQARPTVPMPDHEPADVRDDHDRTETRLDVWAALAQLPKHQRLALVLVDLQAMPVAEAAAVLGVPEGTVKSRCARGRAALAPLLRPPPTRVVNTTLVGGQGNHPAVSDVPPLSTTDMSTTDTEGAGT